MDVTVNPSAQALTCSLPARTISATKAVIQDAFTNTNNTSLDAHSGGGFSWTEYLGTDQDWKISSNQIMAVYGKTSGQRSTARAESNLSGSDMYAQLKIGTFGTNDYKSNLIGVAVRFASDANTCYWAAVGGIGGAPVAKGFRVGKMVAGTMTVFATVNYAYSAGDILKLTVEGNTLTVYINGVQQWQDTDTSITTGVRAGLSSYLDHWATSALGDDFEAGDLGGGGTSVTVNASAQTATLSAPAPTINTGTGMTVNADVQTITSEYPLPTLLISADTVDVTVNAGVQTATFSQPATTVSAQRNVSISASVQSALFSVINPIVTAIRNVTVTIGVLTSTFTAPAPAISTVWNVAISPPVQTMTASLPSPNINTTKSISVSPEAQTGTFSVPSPSVFVAGGITINAGVQTLTTTIPQPTTAAQRNILSSVPTETATFSLISPIVTASKNSSVSPNVQTLTASLPAPTITAQRNIAAGLTAQALIFSLLTPEIVAEITGNCFIYPSSQTASFLTHKPSVVTQEIAYERIFLVNSGRFAIKLKGNKYFQI